MAPVLPARSAPPSLPPENTGAKAKGEQGGELGHVAAQWAFWFSMNSTGLAGDQSTAHCPPGARQRTSLLMEGAGPTPTQIIPNSFPPNTSLGRCSKPRGHLLSPYRSHQISLFPSSEAALKNPPRSGLGGRPRVLSCVALAQCTTSLSLLPPLGLPL